jgi:putative phage-type endonuclease
MPAASNDHSAMPRHPSVERGLTLDQLTRRQLGIGASEAGAVLGLDPYRTGYAVWLAKTGRAMCSNGAPSIAARRGQYLEPLVAELYAARFPGVTLTQGTTLAHPDHPCILATPDFVVVGDGDARLVECKSKLWRTARGFGEEGTDEVPDSIQLQVQQQMLVTGLSRCDVAVLIDDEFRVYPVQANPSIQQVLLERLPAWWQRHVVEGIAPDVDGSEAAAEHLRATLMQQSPDLRDGTPEEQQAMEQLVDATQRLKSAEADKARFTQSLMQAAGEAAGIITAAGRFTWKEQQGRTTTQWQAVALAAGATDSLVAAHTTTAAPIRVARFSPARS